MVTNSTYPTFCLHDDPAIISLYQSHDSLLLFSTTTACSKNMDRHISRLYLEKYRPHLTAGGDSNLTAIHNTRDLLLPTSYRLRVILETLTKLGHLSSILGSQRAGADNGFRKLATCMAYHKDRVEGFLVGVEVLKEKVKDILNMTTLGLDFRMTNQMLDLNNRMVELNNRMLNANQQLLELGTKSFDDNATVKVVTILTLIYLPASLVSEFRISKQFWIYVVATIILAIITVSVYLWTHKKQVRRRNSHPVNGTPQDTEEDADT
ncbi:hypothetical protein N7534_007184 [Penicillium rubens]|nr:hypothetical protein N7534_007184 [Penicillium rubens]